MSAIDKKLAEISEWEKVEIEKLDLRFPEYCEEFCAASDELQAAVDAKKLAAYAEWEESEDYAAFQRKQAKLRRARYYA